MQKWNPTLICLLYKVQVNHVCNKLNILTFTHSSIGSLDSACDSENMNSLHNVSEESIKPQENIEENAVARNDLDATDNNALNFAAELSKKLGLPPSM